MARRMVPRSFLAQYDVELPNRRALIALIAFGWVVAGLSAAGLVWSFFAFLEGWGRPREYCMLINEPYGYAYYAECGQVEPSLFSLRWLYEHWYVGVITLVLGVAVATLFKRRFDHFFRRVRQGKVVSMDTAGGGDHYLNWMLLVEGYTYANELRRWWVSVNAGYWRNRQVGDYVDFR